jgi:hypothetical protein
MATGKSYRWKPVNVQNEIREIFHYTDTVTHLIQSWRKHDFNRDIATELTGRGGHEWLLRCVNEFVVLLKESLPCFAAAFLVYSVLVPPTRHSDHQHTTKGNKLGSHHEFQIERCTLLWNITFWHKWVIDLNNADNVKRNLFAFRRAEICRFNSHV